MAAKPESLDQTQGFDLYYSQAIFEFQSMELLEIWAKTLSQQQRDQLSELRVKDGWRMEVLIQGPDAISRAALRFERKLLQQYHRELQEIGAGVPQNVLRTYWLLFRRRPHVVEQRIWMNERQLSERVSLDLDSLGLELISGSLRPNQISDDRVDVVSSMTFYQDEESETEC